MTEHPYDNILRRKNALENQRKAFELMHAATLEKIQSDCTHIDTASYDCVLCGFTMKHKSIPHWATTGFIWDIPEEKNNGEA